MNDDWMKIINHINDGNKDEKTFDVAEKIGKISIGIALMAQNMHKENPDAARMFVGSQFASIIMTMFDLDVDKSIAFFNIIKKDVENSFETIDKILVK